MNPEITNPQSPLQMTKTECIKLQNLLKDIDEPVVVVRDVKIRYNPNSILGIVKTLPKYKIAENLMILKENYELRPEFRTE